MDPLDRSRARSIAYHRAVADKLRAAPAEVEHARARVQGWHETGEVHPRWARMWAELLARPLDELLAALIDPTEPMCTLRSCSPFAGVLDPRERWEIFRRFRRDGVGRT